MLRDHTGIPSAVVFCFAPLCTMDLLHAAEGLWAPSQAPGALPTAVLAPNPTHYCRAGPRHSQPSLRLACLALMHVIAAVAVVLHVWGWAYKGRDAKQLAGWQCTHHRAALSTTSAAGSAC